MREIFSKTEDEEAAQWPPRHLRNPSGDPTPFHQAQQTAQDSDRRIVAMVAGTQSGKTSYGPWWLKQEIDRCGSGDYLVVTSSYDLFSMKLLPEMIAVYEHILGIGRYWAQAKVIELKDPETGEFWAKKSTDPMWARIILRSAQSGSRKAQGGSVAGLESSTAKAAWLDEAGQDDFTIDAWRSIRRRLALHRGRILITTTLYNLAWVKQQIMDRAVEGGTVTATELDNSAEIEVTDNAGADICLIQFDSIANPAMSVEEYKEAEDDLPTEDFLMFWRGRAARLRHLIYDNFDRVAHTCPRFTIPDEWKRFMGVDFGGVNTAALYYAEEPETRKLYCYREYKAGGRTAADHTEAMLEGEPGRPYAVGGAKSEGQWRQEFAEGGLPLRAPSVHEVNIGINRVYGCHKRDEIIYFDDLEGVLDQKGKYQRKQDAFGETTDEIKDKARFHFLDAERYIISDIRGLGVVQFG